MSLFGATKSFALIPVWLRLAPSAAPGTPLAEASTPPAGSSGHSSGISSPLLPALHPPDLITHLSSAICHPPSAIRHPPSVIRHPPSAIRHLLPHSPFRIPNSAFFVERKGPPTCWHPGTVGGPFRPFACVADLGTSEKPSRGSRAPRSIRSSRCGARPAYGW